MIVVIAVMLVVVLVIMPRMLEWFARRLMNPAWMMVLHPILMVFDPPVAGAPVMLVVEVAVIGATPILMPLGPLRMIPPKVVGIVVVPP